MSGEREKCRALIVEDDAQTTHALRRLLDEHEIELEFASTLQGALEKLAWNPSCLLLDLNLPDGNGVELLRQIRDERLPMRVGIMTGEFDPLLLADVYELQPDAFFRKPRDAHRLVRWLTSPPPPVEQLPC